MTEFTEENLPDECPRCGSDLTVGKDLKGIVLVCCKAGCGVVWERKKHDSQSPAIREQQTNDNQN